MGNEDGGGHASGAKRRRKVKETDSGDGWRRKRERGTEEKKKRSRGIQVTFSANAKTRAEREKSRDYHDYSILSSGAVDQETRHQRGKIFSSHSHLHFHNGWSDLFSAHLP